jgi:carbonic anhydrase/acetyltransferase-like protein (isoleucine patch superfamily)
MKPQVITYDNITPQVHSSCILFPGTHTIGDVHIGADSSVWFGSIIRGDVNYIRIGERTNIQDNTVIHVTTGGSPTIIGDNVTIGHAAIIHACTIKDRVLVGMGSTIMDDVTVGEDCIIGAGSLLTSGKSFPSGHLVMGSPAKIIRPLNAKELERLKKSASQYIKLAKSYSFS